MNNFTLLYFSTFFAFLNPLRPPRPAAPWRARAAQARQTPQAPAQDKAGVREEQGPDEAGGEWRLRGPRGKTSRRVFPLLW